MNRIRNILVSRFTSIACVLTMLSCESFLNVEDPVSKIPGNLIFADDAAATSAVIGMYITLSESNSFAGGGTSSLLMMAGLSADELVNVPQQDRLYLDFEQNNISPSNDNILSLWGSLYRCIYSANAILDGLAASSYISSAMKTQLRGEALFVRAFCFFYLTNTFGNIPLVVSTNYKVNARLPRSSQEEVYVQIIKDLTDAEDLLSDEYIDMERTRVNKYTSTAFLSRVYLYKGDWARAEEKATNVIANTSVYSLVDLNEVFIANSHEAIWQIRPLTPDPVASEAGMFSFVSARIYNALNDNVGESFESGDTRFSTWVTSYPDPVDTLWLPSKYKRTRAGSGLPKEYSMVLRVAELYLIRAEARAEQNRITTAIEDIDAIRYRAGLPSIQVTNPSTLIDKEMLLRFIEQERKIELLTEWGHRWFDLNRWGRSSAVLGLIKPDWSNDDKFYPIPEIEIRKNEQLQPQNSGY